MKLYEFAAAPSPRRVRIFLAEKGIVVPTVHDKHSERLLRLETAFDDGIVRLYALRNLSATAGAK
jgi:glutathione S-transferase